MGKMTDAEVASKTSRLSDYNKIRELYSEMGSGSSWGVLGFATIMHRLGVIEGIRKERARRKGGALV
jgi:hypothetical protein